VFTQFSKFHLKTSIWGFEKAVERYAIGAYAKSIKEAKELLIKHVEQLKHDNITENTIDRVLIDKARLTQKSPSKNSPTPELLAVCSELPYPQEYALRFLTASHFNQSKALHLAEKAKKKKALLAENLQITMTEFLEKYLPACVHPMRDADDDIIVVFKIATFNLKRCWKNLGTSLFIKCIMQMMESIIKGENITQGKFHSLKKVTLIADFEGLTSKHLYRPGLQMVMDTFDALKLCYPEFLKLVVCTHSLSAYFPCSMATVNPIH